VISSNFGDFPDNVNIVLGVCNKFGFSYGIRAFNQGAHHAEQAARLLRCSLGAVVKSLVFETKSQAAFILVLVSGQNRVDSEALSEIIGSKVYPAKPEKVLTLTGYPVGAVPPFGIDGDPLVIIDADLLSYQDVWAAAGSVKHPMGFKSKWLPRLTQGDVYDIKDA